MRRPEEAGNPKLSKPKSTANYERIHVLAGNGHKYKSPLYRMPLKGGYIHKKKYVKAEHLNGEVYGRFVYDVLGSCL
jgi:hypothetical protein